MNLGLWTVESHRGFLSKKQIIQNLLVLTGRLQDLNASGQEDVCFIDQTPA